MVPLVCAPASRDTRSALAGFQISFNFLARLYCVSIDALGLAGKGSYRNLRKPPGFQDRSSRLTRPTWFEPVPIEAITETNIAGCHLCIRSY